LWSKTKKIKAQQGRAAKVVGTSSSFKETSQKNPPNKRLFTGGRSHSALSTLLPKAVGVGGDNVRTSGYEKKNRNGGPGPQRNGTNGIESRSIQSEGCLNGSGGVLGGGNKRESALPPITRIIQSTAKGVLWVENRKRGIVKSEN